MYVLPPLSMAIHLTLSLPVPHHLTARIYAPVEEIFAVNVSTLLPVLDNTVDPNEADHPINVPAMYVLPPLSAATAYA